jgi:ribosomal protection tetracycline resistance protein
VRTLNLGILAHVDAGKTTLTERLLFGAGVIDEPGSVDAGSTQTDTLALERARGITIRSAVVSFAVGDVTVNLIDTPGHPDFIAEVERVLSVLDGAVLVVSGVEGVQAQTRVLMRTLRRLGIPTLIFVNKLDRVGARLDAVRHEIRERLTADAEILAGSARSGAGVPELTDAVVERLPARIRDADAPLAGSVFKIERGPKGERIAYACVRAGTLHVRDRLDTLGKVTALRVFEDGDAVSVSALPAGRIGLVQGLSEVRIGDALGAADAEREHHFAPPTLETVVVPADEADRGALRVALVQLAEQDPLIGLRDEATLSLYGEVQQEVIEATLRDEYGIAVGFRETTTICIERPTGSGAAFELLGEGDNDILATVGLRVDPAPLGAGVSFGLEVELGSMPAAFFTAVEETVHATLRGGGPHGWRVADCVVTMTHSGYSARQSHSHATFDKSMSSTAGDFRTLTAIVLRRALERAGTAVWEPVHAFSLEVPADTVGALFGVLGRLGAIVEGQTLDGWSATLDGTIPAARVHELRMQLPGITRGEGVLESAFADYRLSAGATRPRPRSRAR